MREQEPGKMLAAVVDAFGSPDQLALRTMPRPEIGPGEVLVRVRVAGVQPVDAAIRSGWSPAGVAAEPPLIVGNEFAGVVERVGADVADFAAGDEVLGFRVLGCYAEYVSVPADQLVHKPAAVSWLTAGTLSASGQTAHTALERLGVAAGETLLVHGAAGGVGAMAVQLARARGVRVIGTASAANQEYVRSLGAIAVEYGVGQLERIRDAGGGQLDAVFDTAGQDNLLTAVQLVLDRGRIGTVADMNLSRFLGCQWIRSDRSVARLRELLAHCEQRELAVAVRATYPLAQAAAAHRDIETGHGRGKIALLVDPDVASEEASSRPPAQLAAS